MRKRVLQRFDLYWKHTPHEIEWFVPFMLRHADCRFFQPNAALAPWHVMAELPNGIFMHFWPHKFKCMIDDDPKSVSICPEDTIALAKTIKPIRTEDLIDDQDNHQAAIPRRHQPVLTGEGTIPF